MRDSLPPMGKFFRLRCVCAPQYLALSTWTSPKVSDSVLKLSVPILAVVVYRTAAAADEVRDVLVLCSNRLRPGLCSTKALLTAKLVPLLQRPWSAKDADATGRKNFVCMRVVLRCCVSKSGRIEDVRMRAARAASWHGVPDTKKEPYHPGYKTPLNTVMKPLISFRTQKPASQQRRGNSSCLWGKPHSMTLARIFDPYAMALSFLVGGVGFGMTFFFNTNVEGWGMHEIGYPAMAMVS